MSNSTTTTPYATPWTDDDQWIECGANDPWFGPATEWPSWCDGDRFELGPEPDPVPPREDNEPLPDDLDDLEIDEDLEGPLWEGSDDEWPCYTTPDPDELLDAIERLDYEREHRITAFFV